MTRQKETTAITQCGGMLLHAGVRRIIDNHLQWVIAHGNNKPSDGRINLTDYEFIGTNFVQETLFGAIFTRCKFHKCIFDEAILRGAIFVDCEFHGGSMQGTCVRSTLFRGGGFYGDIALMGVETNSRTVVENVMMNTRHIPHLAGAWIDGVRQPGGGADDE